MRRRPLELALATVTATTLVLTGCSGDDDDTEPADLTPVQVSYTTAFGTNGRDAYAWVAQERGYFEEAGLEVEILAGAGTGPNLEGMEAGEVDFTSLDMTGAMIEAGNGNATNFRAIAAVHQSTLVAIISLEGYDVTTPTDLAGKQIGAAANSVNQLLFPAYASVAGLDPNSVEWVDAAPPDLPSLLADRDADALSTFLIGATGIENAAGGTPSVVLPYSEYLTDLYGNGLYASTEMIEEQPDVVIRFRDAMLRALAWSLDNPEESAQVLAENNEDISVEAAVGEINAMSAAVVSAGTVGVLDEAQVARAITLVQGAGLIPPGLRPDEFVAFDLALTTAA